MKDNTKEKVGFGSRIGKFFVDCKAELKKVVWASRKSTIRNTIVVCAAVIIISAFTGVFDFLFSGLINLLNQLV